MLLYLLPLNQCLSHSGSARILPPLFHSGYLTEVTTDGMIQHLLNCGFSQFLTVASNEIYLFAFLLLCVYPDANNTVSSGKVLFGKSQCFKEKGDFPQTA